MAPFMLFRWVFGWFGFVIAWMTYCFIKLTMSKDQKLDGWREETMRLAIKFAGAVTMLAMGCFSYSQEQIKVDYTEYLGEEFELTYDRPGSVVSNHQCFMDIVVHLFR